MSQIDTNLMDVIAKENKSILTRLYCIDDTVTGRRFVEVYTDDGNGNGNIVLQIPLSDLIRAVNDYDPEHLT